MPTPAQLAAFDDALAAARAARIAATVEKGAEPDRTLAEGNRRAQRALAELVVATPGWSERRYADIPPVDHTATRERLAAEKASARKLLSPSA
ncbi:hypothetical protein [Georgenia sp. SYP-B2076]|uniref:hypothetical protein n=1 Tax=Georgenia sp. SYP-B2076 TaxID=2495881 RepID=UPI000F8D46EC|nr:hypothetical protein [Georgenia sp. SYP-B2076]